jgi:hypothetical protein
MGDNGKLYIPEDEVPEYKALLREADLILPNQFEAEWVMRHADVLKGKSLTIYTDYFQIHRLPISTLLLLQYKRFTRRIRCLISSSPLCV